MLRLRKPFTGIAPGSTLPVARLHGLLLALCLAVASALRFCCVSWDGGFWLHPDERQIYFVANGLGWPETLSQALQATSPLNPHFFAYGSLPIYLVRLIALLLAPVWPALRDPGNLHLAGRPLAALLDVGTAALVYRLAVHLARGRSLPGKEGGGAWSASSQTASGLLAAALFSLAVLPIQSSHFYTADGLLTFLAMLSLNLASSLVLGTGRGRRAALGVALGLALATKLSAAPLLLLVPAAIWLRGPQPSPRLRLEVLKASLSVLLVAAATFLAVEPYALIDVRLFLSDSLRESQIAWGRLDVPYTRQFAGTLPYLFSIWQTALWGMGLPAGMLGWAGLAAGLIRWLREGEWGDSLLLAWAGPYFAITGALYARPLRYMLPLVPVLSVAAARLVVYAYRRATRAGRRWLVAGSGLVLLASLACAFLFLSAYASPHPWIAASSWIYRHVPAGSTVTVEEWDTPLPLPIEVDGRDRRSEEYSLRSLTLYSEPDDMAKWQHLAQDLAATDYLVVASRRLYGSILRLPGRYPIATRYYSLLFEGGLGFELVGEFTRGAGWLNPRLEPLPRSAPPLFVPDESLVVYDRPRVLLFRNAGRLSPEALLHRLGLAGEQPGQGRVEEGSVAVGVGPGVSVGHGVSVGAGVSVGQGVCVGAGVSVGQGVSVDIGVGVGGGFCTSTHVRASTLFPQRSKATTRRV
jgi:hypothetical protein